MLTFIRTTRSFVLEFPPAGDLLFIDPAGDLPKLHTTQIYTPFWATSHTYQDGGQRFTFASSSLGTLRQASEVLGVMEACSTNKHTQQLVCRNVNYWTWSSDRTRRV